MFPEKLHHFCWLYLSKWQFSFLFFKSIFVKGWLLNNTAVIATRAKSFIINDFPNSQLSIHTFWKIYRDESRIRMQMSFDFYFYWRMLHHFLDYIDYTCSTCTNSKFPSFYHSTHAKFYRPTDFYCVLAQSNTVNS